MRLNFVSDKVSEKVFPEALDRFAQQFISPLLLKDALQRERQSVDSEFQMALSSDSVRISSFFRMFINENHPASYFDYGNLKTLKDDITDDDLYAAVREFFKKYVANIMYLTVQSKRSLDEMQELVVGTFSSIKSGPVVSRPKMPVNEVFLPKFFDNMYYVKPRKESKTLLLSWYIDSVESHYKCRPLKYLKAVFRNQGEGGIVAHLRDHQLAIGINLEIDSQAFEANSMFALIKISVQLTDFGLQNVDKILEAIFSYLLMIKETPVEEHRRLYNDYKEKNELQFKFHKEGDASENVVGGSIGMKYFENVDIIRGQELYQGFDEKIIFDVINAMNQRKFNMIIVYDKHQNFDKKEKYFGIEYEELTFPEAYQKLWDERKSNPDFFLEKPNPFKATNFNIFVNEEESPVRFEDNFLN